MNRRDLLATPLAGLLIEQSHADAEPSAASSNQLFDAHVMTPYADVRRYGVIGDGITDDTEALQSALRVDTKTGLALMIPAGVTVKITHYVEIFSSTVLCIFGKLLLTDRQSGLFTNDAKNVGIYGNKIGQILDLSVAANYMWNKSPNYAPAIHIRSGSSIMVDGLNISYCSSGVFVSSATKNWLPGIDWTLTQPPPRNVKVQNCTLQFCEMSGLALLVGYHSGFYSNYVYRCGDGGIWMMGSDACEVIGNHRISPKSTMADIQKYGYNNPLHPSTWNDEQGIEFQSSFDLLIADNVVENFCFYGIDVKDYCNRVMITRNRVRFCEQASIIVREGDAGNVGSVGKVSIIGNFITGHGKPLISDVPTHAAVGAISVSSCFIAEIINNVIYSYRLTPGIVCLGPGHWQAGATGQYLRNPQQASITLTGNAIAFTAPMAMDATESLYTSATLSAIVIDGDYTSVKCNDNDIRTDRYYHSDIRSNSSPAIALTYRAGQSANYPTSASINNNEVVGWGSTGIAVTGQSSISVSGLTVSGNLISGAGATAISLASTHGAICNSNNIAQNNAMNGASYGILLQGDTSPLRNVMCSSNSISGSSAGRGGNSLDYGIAIKHCDEINCANNSVIDFNKAPFLVEHSTGSIFTQGCSTFPRTGMPPNGNVVSFHRGEVYYDTQSDKWWIADTFASTNWTPLSK